MILSWYRYTPPSSLTHSLSLSIERESVAVIVLTFIVDRPCSGCRCKWRAPDNTHAYPRNCQWRGFELASASGLWVTSFGISAHFLGSHLYTGDKKGMISFVLHFLQAVFFFSSSSLSFYCKFNVPRFVSMTLLS